METVGLKRGLYKIRWGFFYQPLLTLGSYVSQRLGNELSLHFLAGPDSKFFWQHWIFSGRFFKGVRGEGHPRSVVLSYYKLLVFVQVFTGQV